MAIDREPYKKQWWMTYFDITLTEGIVKFKMNKFTGTVWIFTKPKEGNRWNEPGYGWGLWKKL